jgi:lipopolysaccharide biosynthesis glycosyltransferase
MLSDYNLETKNYPVIIHFSGVKPWSPKSRTIFKFQYHEAMKVAKYEELVPKPTLLDRLEYVIIKSLDKSNIKKFRINYFL